MDAPREIYGNKMPEMLRANIMRVKVGLVWLRVKEQQRETGGES